MADGGWGKCRKLGNGVLLNGVLARSVEAVLVALSGSHARVLIP